LMDLIMQVMDGAEATRQIMQNSPCAILVVPAPVTGNASKIFDAMRYGALDAVNTPVLGMSGSMEGAAALLSKMETIAKLIGKHSRAYTQGLLAGSQSVSGNQPLIAIAASTGGPLVLARILRAL